MKYIMTMMLWCLTVTGMAQQVRDEEMAALREWRAGTVVSLKAVEAFGMERCFAVEAIPDGVWQRMQGKTYKPNPNIGRDDLRHLRVLHKDLKGRTVIGEMVCNKKIASELRDIFKELYEASYPIERMVLADEYDADDERQMRANNTSCFCYRVVEGTTSLSKHALGLAVDLNPLYNPYIRYRKNGKRIVQPATATPYCDRKANFPYKITTSDLAYKLFMKHGFRWGGSWTSSKDYQHFDKK